jgi:hypothetical protein
MQHTHDKLLHFLARASWDDHAVRRVAARYALAAMSARGEAVMRISRDREHQDRPIVNTRIAGT